MTVGLAALVLLFGMLAYGGAGACAAVARARAVEHEREVGMMGVAALLLGFGVLCSVVLGGVAAALAIGAPAAVATYLLTAQRAGLFRLESGPLGEVPVEESHRPY